MEGGPAIVVTGVSGTGKSTVGLALAERLGASFIDADDLHPAQNVQKMAAGTPLTDSDREPWLRLVAAAIEATAGPVVVACSALRRAYRDLLQAHAGRQITFVELSATRETLVERLTHRTGHFMPVALLDSQLDTLESLAADESGFVVDAEPPVDAIIDDVAERLGRTAF